MITSRRPLPNFCLLSEVLFWLIAGAVLFIPLAPEQCSAEDELSRPTTLAQASLSALSVKLVRDLDQESSYLLSATPKKKAGELRAEVFAVDNPLRLVLDVYARSAAAAPKAEVKDVNISSLRTGVHADKTRIVLDIRSEILPHYKLSADETSGGVIVNFGFEAGRSSKEAQSVGRSALPAARQAQAPEVSQKAEEEAKIDLKRKEAVVPKTAPASKEEKLPPEEEPLAEPLDRKKIESELLKPQPLRDSSHTSDLPAAKGGVVALPRPEEPEQKILTAPTRSKEEEAEKLLSGSKSPVFVVKGDSETSPTQDSGKSADESQQVAALTGKVSQTGKPLSGAMLEGISYRTIENSGASAVVLNTKELETYSLSRSKANLYELILQNTKLAGSHLGHPQFPPEKFKGFEVVIARQKDDDVELKIHTESGVKLSPFRVKDEIWLKVSP